LFSVGTLLPTEDSLTDSFFSACHQLWLQQADGLFWGGLVCRRNGAPGTVSRQVEIGSASSRDGAGVSNHAIACRWAIRAVEKNGRGPEPAVLASQKMPNNKQGVESRAGALLQNLSA
jgi:hypothetical protein